MMVAYIDEFKDRFKVGPIRRVPAASLDCGFITPRRCAVKIACQRQSLNLKNRCAALMRRKVR